MRATALRAAPLALVAAAACAETDGLDLDPGAPLDAGASRDAEPLPPDLGPPPDSGVDAGAPPAPECAPSFVEHNAFTMTVAPETPGAIGYQAGGLVVAGLTPVTFTTNGQRVQALAPALHLVPGGAPLPVNRIALASHPARAVVALQDRDDASFVVSTGGTSRAPEANGVHVVRFEPGARNPSHEVWQGLRRSARLWAVATSTTEITLVTGDAADPTRLDLDRWAPGDADPPGPNAIEVDLGDGSPASAIAAAPARGGLTLVSVHGDRLVVRGVRFADGAVVEHGAAPGFDGATHVEAVRTGTRIVAAIATEDALSLVSAPADGPWTAPEVVHLPYAGEAFDLAARADLIAVSRFEPDDDTHAITFWSPELAPRPDLPFRPVLRTPEQPGSTVIGHDLAAGPDDWALVVTREVPGGPTGEAASVHHAVARFGDCGL